MLHGVFLSISPLARRPRDSSITLEGLLRTRGTLLQVYVLLLIGRFHVGHSAVTQATVGGGGALGHTLEVARVTRASNPPPVSVDALSFRSI